jgi:hypothetical protein
VTLCHTPASLDQLVHGIIRSFVGETKGMSWSYMLHTVRSFHHHLMQAYPYLSFN